MVLTLVGPSSGLLIRMVGDPVGMVRGRAVAKVGAACKKATCYDPRNEDRWDMQIVDAAGPPSCLQTWGNGDVGLPRQHASRSCSGSGVN